MSPPSESITRIRPLRLARRAAVVLPEPSRPQNRARTYSVRPFNGLNRPATGRGDGAGVGAAGCAEALVL
nr:MAG TPA: hypothetical protein [Caudoviricetes sp.]